MSTSLFPTAVRVVEPIDVVEEAESERSHPVRGILLAVAISAGFWAVVIRLVTAH